MIVAVAMYVCHQSERKDTLAEWLRRRPAKPMGSPRVGSTPTGVALISYTHAVFPRATGNGAHGRDGGLSCSSSTWLLLRGFEPAIGALLMCQPNSEAANDSTRWIALAKAISTSLFSLVGRAPAQ